MSKSKWMTLAGWGNYPRQDSAVARPERWRTLQEVVSSQTDGGVISRGNGRSYGDAALNAEGGVVSHLQLNRLLDFDAATGVVECEAGVTFAKLIHVFLPRGFFLPVTPGTKLVTVGGAIAADVHGKNHHGDGSLASFVLDFRLLTGTGEVLICSAEQNADVFWATLGGMGLTGAILSARIRLLPVGSAYLRTDRIRTSNLDATLESFSTSDAAYRYSVAWIDCLASGPALGRSVILGGNHVDADGLPDGKRRDPFVLAPPGNRSVPMQAPGFVLNSASVSAFNAFYYRRNSSRQNLLMHYEPFFYPLDSLLNWNRLYGKRGFIQYQAVVNTGEGIKRLLEKITQSRRASFLAVLKAFGPANEGLLSFPKAGFTLALDIPNKGSDLLDFVRALDRIVLDHDGRVYLAKDALLEAASFDAMYPLADRFRHIKSRLDPEQQFTSSLARRLGIVAAT